MSEKHDNYAYYHSHDSCPLCDDPLEQPLTAHLPTCPER